MKKVLVAMSGGVDSSMAATLLKEQGFEVIGVFFRLHNDYREAEKKAKLNAKKIGVDFYSLDIRKEFKQKIINTFVQDIKKGITPNPCVVCNKEIKFNVLFDQLKKLKADYIATGHYVRVKQGRLFKAKDKTKDQSYFLWRLNKRILKRALFPAGKYTKEEIKKMARKLDLKVASDSQEICFINSDINDFLRENLKTEPGNIINTDGDIIGKHEGLCFYTIGQRKGIGLAGGPYYVLAKNMKKNQLIVTKREKELFSKEVEFKDINWISQASGRLQAKIRYQSPSASGTLKGNKFIFNKSQKAVTLGQSIVFYNKDELIGGGVIK